MRKPELLAPAGNREAFEAAIAAGADAVYLGAAAFNARRNADNFAPEDLRAACKDAHLRGREVFLAANTLVFPGEMDEALHTVAQAAECGIDAAIVQDVGLASVLRRELPGLELHASTQMNIRDATGVETARKLGFARATLARELSCEQIAQLTGLGVDIEVFVHGALCVCQSGQCLFSSMVGGRSANRGLCAQPCRMPYKLLDEQGKNLVDAGQYLLSPKDLCGIELLPQLIDAGVASLKIEGRMKSSEYVSTVTSVYRKALDRAWLEEDLFEVEEEEASRLSGAFNRGLTKAYLVGERGNDMMGYTRPNNRGCAVGRIEGFADGLVKLNTTQPLAVGDVLEVWTCKGRVTHAVSQADSLRAGKVRLAIRGAVAVGDRVFRVRSAALEQAAQECVKQGLRIPVAIDVTLHAGKPLEVNVHDDAGHSAGAKGPLVQPARTKAITREEVIEHVGRLGSTPYVCDTWNVQLDEGVGMGFSQLHKVRAAALEAFAEEVLAAQRRRTGASAQAGIDITSVDDASSMAPFVTAIDFSDTDVALELSAFAPGKIIGPKLYATNADALRTWAALGATFAWLSPELTLKQIRQLCDDAPLPLGLVVNGRQELMVSDHCFLRAQGPCNEQCAICKRRDDRSFLEDRKGYKFPVATDAQGRGHIYNAVPFDAVSLVGELLDAGVRGFAVDATLMTRGKVENEMNRVRSVLHGHEVEKEPDTTTGHLFRLAR